MKSYLLASISTVPVETLSNDLLETLHNNYKTEEALISDDTSMSTQDKIRARRESLYFYIGGVLLISVVGACIKNVA